ncbi:MAG: hypothetical protein Nkreftii_004171 [Candidatus Nitrospira kreftii]|uniref:Uncharacterized protein n=1 Tax=Candidatus Nitrospira kreftii TaxID=2652173 RepID=A0A7S8FIH4_9BACT|nr:MAG: hypothetical protein Nkreftii_004171 [Candidatus Nitrospira kreftii]
MSQKCPMNLFYWSSLVFEAKKCTLTINAFEASNSLDKLNCAV